MEGILIREKLLLRLMCVLSKIAQAGGGRRALGGRDPTGPQEEEWHGRGSRKGFPLGAPDNPSSKAAPRSEGGPKGTFHSGSTGFPSPAPQAGLFPECPCKPASPGLGGRDPGQGLPGASGEGVSGRKRGSCGQE